MKIDHDILSAEDRALLTELGARLRPHATDLGSEWAAAWERALPRGDIDADAYRQMVGYLADQSVQAVVGFLVEADFEGLYEFQYRNNREGAARQLVAGAETIYGQRELHLAARAGQPVMAAWINRVFAREPQTALRVQLAQERLGTQLDTLLSEAYSDEREGHLEALRRRLELALKLSERLRTLGQTIAQSLEIEPVLDVAMHTAMDLLGGESCGLTLGSPDGTQIQLRALVGSAPVDIGRWVPAEGSLSGWVFLNDHVARSDRSLPDLGERSREAIERLGVRAFVIAPMRSRGRPIGALGVSWQHQRSFTRDEVELMQSLADAVGVAVENARIHAEMRQALHSAERANRAKSEFVAAVSHEIRSPLSALLGYADLLRAGELGPVTQEQEEACNRLQAIALSTLRLTDDLLDQARLESGALPVHVGEVRLGPLLAEVSEHAKMLIGAKAIDFVCSSSAEIGSVQADADRLRQVLVNLIGNAVKFTREGAIRMVVRSSRPVGMVAIAVEDTGIGIASHDLPHLFDLFYRAEGSAKTTAGAGIGLFLSRQLARAMGGDLVVESEPGKGSTFTLTVRAA